jgi:hypothetical protein
MTGELLLLLVGVTLVLAALVAIAARGRSTGFARLHGWPLTATLAAGALCVSAGSIVLLSRDPTGVISEPITDTLSSDEFSEHVRVIIDGREIGVVRIDERSPHARLTVTVAKEGRYAYRTESIVHFKGKRPLTNHFEGKVFIDGKGTLQVSVDDVAEAFVAPA